MAKILITGGTGLVGKALTKMLHSHGHKVTILTRKIPTQAPATGIQYAIWDLTLGKIDKTALDETEYIIHLAGAAVVEKKWTARYKKEIIDSRTRGMDIIADQLKNNSHQLKAVISASAIGWYGPDQSTGISFSESAPAAKDFLGETCRIWEESLIPFSAMGIRTCALRTGIVLTREGGALKEFEKPVRLGIAAILGNGKQKVSWIHLEDLCRMYCFAIEKEINGAYNAVAPAPVSNAELTLGIAKKMKGNFFISAHVPEFVLKLMMGERSVEVLKSCTVSAEKIKEAGFTFHYPSIDAALQSLYP
ncbi:MAG: TIGR01777 family oxidoreductase [Sphingobacteriales bacterium]|nr:TIGR01777 family oxidoreductase [Sphingobacteriales bacterium]